MNYPNWFSEGEKEFYEKIFIPTENENEINILTIGVFFGESTKNLAKILEKKNYILKFMQ